MFYGNTVLKQQTIDTDHVESVSMIESVCFTEYKNRLAMYEACTNESDKLILEAQLEVLSEISIKDIGSKIKKFFGWLWEKFTTLLNNIKKFINNIRLKFMRKRLDELDDYFDDIEEDYFNSNGENYEDQTNDDFLSDMYKERIEELKDKIDKLKNDKESDKSKIEQLRSELEKQRELYSKSIEKTKELYDKNSEQKETIKKEKQRADNAEAESKRKSERIKELEDDNHILIHNRNFGSLYEPFVEVLGKYCYNKFMYFKPENYLDGDVKSKAKEVSDAILNISSIDFENGSEDQYKKYLNISLTKKFPNTKLIDQIYNDLEKYENKNSLEKAATKGLLKQYSGLLKRELDNAEKFLSDYKDVTQTLREASRKASKIADKYDMEADERVDTIKASNKTSETKIDVKNDQTVNRLRDTMELFDNITHEIRNNIYNLNMLFAYTKNKIKYINRAINYCSVKLGLEQVKNSNSD